MRLRNNPGSFIIMLGVALVAALIYGIWVHFENKRWRAENAGRLCEKCQSASLKLSRNWVRCESCGHTTRKPK